MSQPVVYFSTVDGNQRNLPNVVGFETRRDRERGGARGAADHACRHLLRRGGQGGCLRGDLRAIVEEVRRELDVHGYPDVKIFLSGGLSRDAVAAYRDGADACGVGGAIANAPVIDFAMDIVEMEGRPYAKRGKRSSAKQVYEGAGRRGTLPLGAPALEGGVPLLVPCIRDGAVVARPKMEDARERVPSRLSGLAGEG